MKKMDVRWIQRFENFEKSLLLLENNLKVREPDILQKAGLIQFFEMTFELAWKLLKDYLEDQGHINIASPRSVIKKAFEVGLIDDGHLWIRMMEERNETVHAYDEKNANALNDKINQLYINALLALRNKMIEKKEQT